MISMENFTTLQLNEDNTVTMGSATLFSDLVLFLEGVGRELSKDPKHQSPTHNANQKPSCGIVPVCWSNRRNAWGRLGTIAGLIRPYE